MYTVPELLAKRELFSDQNSFTIDLKNVDRADSAGVALLVRWQREAALAQKKIVFKNIPSQMLAIARVSGVDELLMLEV